MEINNSNGSGSRESARFQIFHLLTSPKSYRSLVPDSYIALPPSKLFGTDSSESFFNIHQLFHFPDFKLQSFNRAGNSQGEWVDPLPRCCSVHTTTYTDKTNVGTLQVKLDTLGSPAQVLIHLNTVTCVPKPLWSAWAVQLALC